MEASISGSGSSSGSPEVPRLVKSNLIGLIAAVGLLTAACGEAAKPETSRPAGSPQADPQDCVDLTGSPTAHVTMTDNTFDPNCYTITSEQSLTIRNEGVSLHNLSVDFRKALTGRDLDVDVSAGEKTKTEAVGETLEPGNYRVFCKYHLPTMVAAMEIR
jgi:plastocyanin